MKNTKIIIKYIPMIVLSLVIIAAIITVPKIIKEATKHTHIYGEWESFREASCSKQGIEQRYCDCGDVQERAIDRVEHTEGNWIVDLDENEKKLYCSVCGQVINIESLGDHTHSFGEWITEIEPTCTEGGLMARYCRCGGKEEKAVKVLDHKYGDWTIKAEPTCTETGIEKRVCECGAEEEREIDKLEHTFGEWETVLEPTCSEEGLQEKYCECGETKERKLNKIEHSYSSMTTTKPATCTELGIKEKECSLCGNIISENIPKKNHDLTSWETTSEPTCKEQGQKSRNCKNCDYTETTMISKSKNHNYGDWSIITEATVEAIGERERECSLCGNIERAEIPKLEYNPDDWEIDENGTLKSVSKNVTGDVTIPSTVKHIGDGAFEDSKNITSITMSDLVLYIGREAFSGCSSLASVKLSSNIEYIKSDAFAYCTSLRNIKISNTVQEIAKYAFSECESLSISYLGSIEEWESLMNPISWKLIGNYTYAVTCNDGIIRLTEKANRVEKEYEYDN